jgi:hypothetical protein
LGATSPCQRSSWGEEGGTPVRSAGCDSCKQSTRAATHWREDKTGLEDGTFVERVGGAVEVTLFYGPDEVTRRARASAIHAPVAQNRRCSPNDHNAPLENVVIVNKAGAEAVDGVLLELWVVSVELSLSVYHQCSQQPRLRGRRRGTPPSLPPPPLTKQLLAQDERRVGCRAHGLRLARSRAGGRRTDGRHARNEGSRGHEAGGVRERDRERKEVRRRVLRVLRLV